MDDPSMSEWPVILGTPTIYQVMEVIKETPTIYQVMEVIKESEFSELAVPWASS